MKIQIKPGLEIGDECPPFVIAEIGSNWQTLDDCLFSIEKAKDCGASAVKFQLYDENALYGFTPGPYSIRDGLAPKTEGKLPHDWLPKLKEKADHTGIEFMCSAFSPELIDVVNPYVNIHKLASAEMCHVRMLSKLRGIGKPIFVSTGAHTPAEIEKTRSWLCDGVERNSLRTPLVLMYCVAAYPARYVDFTTMEALRRQFECLVGFSDHTIDAAEHAQSAVSGFGACVLEKHVNFIPSLETADSLHSLNPYEFYLYCQATKHSWDQPIGPTYEENAMLLRHNRRLLAITDISVGDTLQEGKNFGIYRSLKDERHAYSPFMIGEVKGKKALKAIQAGDGIGDGDI